MHIDWKKASQVVANDMYSNNFRTHVGTVTAEGSDRIALFGNIGHKTQKVKDIVKYLRARMSLMGVKELGFATNNIGDRGYSFVLFMDTADEEVADLLMKEMHGLYRGVAIYKPEVAGTIA